MKRLVYNFDGTANKYDTAYPTNVVMMHKAIANESEDGIEQYSFYLKGVGTNVGEKIIGGAFGYGLFENIIAAYEHLCKYYETGDEIYIFGFSRGAYTARSFAGMIGWCGIIDSASNNQIEEAQNYYKQRLSYLNRPFIKGDKYVEKFNQWRMFNSTSICANQTDFNYRKKVDENNIARGLEPKVIPDIIRIRYIGVWDTVRTLGLSDKFYKWHDHNLSPFVQFARHAVALDERRKKFNVTLWSNIDDLNLNEETIEKKGTPYQQLWFPGTHGSVGGGGSIRGLSDEAFQWIMKGAKDAGLVFLNNPDAEIFTLKPNPLTWLFNDAGEADTFLKKIKKQGFKLLYLALGMKDRIGPETIKDVHQSTIIRYFSPSEYISEKIKYRPQPLKRISRELSINGSPYDRAVYTALHESIRTDNQITDKQKIVSISDIDYLVYIVEKGDSLSTIAKKITGKSSNYKIIHEVNEISIPDEDIIYVGQRILIPVSIVI